MPQVGFGKNVLYNILLLHLNVWEKRTNKHKVTLYIINIVKSNIVKLNIMIHCPFFLLWFCNPFVRKIESFPKQFHFLLFFPYFSKNKLFGFPKKSPHSLQQNTNIVKHSSVKIEKNKIKIIKFFFLLFYLHRFL